MIREKNWPAYLGAIATSQTAIARAAGVGTGTVSRWMSGESRPKAEQVVAVARAFEESPLSALVAAGYLTEAEIRGVDSNVEPRLLSLSDFTELELAQEMVRRVDYPQVRASNMFGDPITVAIPEDEDDLLHQPVDVDHPAWSNVGADTDTDIESLPNAAKKSATEIEEDDHTP